MPVKTSAPVIGVPGQLVFDPLSPFTQSRLKVWRAHRHAHEVSHWWHDTCQSHEGLLRLETNEAGEVLLQVSMPVHSEVSLAIGDYLHCLRSALDYIVSAMARAVDLPDDHIQFPFNEKREIIEASFADAKPQQGQRRPKRARAFHELYGKYPHLKEIILDRVQPYSADYGANASGDVLWRIITSDNIDKHRLIIPTVQRTLVDHAKIGGLTLTNCRLGDGAIVFSGPGAANKKVEDDSTVTVDIFFPEDSRLAGRPVLTTLLEGCNLVSQVIDIFDSLYTMNESPGEPDAAVN